MNYWIKHSIDLANSPGYLDNLMKVYPAKLGEVRPVAQSLEKELKDLVKMGSDIEIISRLLSSDFPVFPIKDPFVAFLRRSRESIKNNPITVGRLAKYIREMGFEKLVESLEKPIEFNRQIGPLFSNWLKTIRFPVLKEDKFIKYNGIAILNGTDATLKDYANKRLAVKLLKGLDLIAKTKSKYVIAEVKFLTDFGGHQQTQFEQALQILKSTERPEIIRIIVLDGLQ